MTATNKKRVLSRMAFVGLLALALAASLVGCSVASDEEATAETETATEQIAGSSDAQTQETVTTTVAYSENSYLDTSDMFTDRDLEQTADLSDATYLTVTSDEDISITEEGVYVISGSAKECTIAVNADDSAKVQLVLDDVTITNSSAPCIYVGSGDKVFVTTTQGSENTLTVTGEFAYAADEKADAVIFSRSDLCLNGLGTLTIDSSDNGVTGKDDLKITGGTYNVTSVSDTFEANDSIRVAGGIFLINSGKDAFHSENDDDDSVGYIYIAGGDFQITAADDGIQGTTVTQIDGGTFQISAVEGIEGTYVQINGGTIDISASDDGINASNKSTTLTPVIEINGGDITIQMAAGDTDALDSNGYLYINGGTVDITAQFAFDFVSGAELNGGTVYVNGEQVTQITESMAMGGAPGDMGGQQMGGAPGEMGSAPSGGMGGQGGPGGQGQGGPGF